MTKLKTPIASDVLKAFRNADKGGKQLLRDLYGDDVCNVDITEIVKTYEDACEYLGIERGLIILEKKDGSRELLTEAQMKQRGFRRDQISQLKLETITFVLNDCEYLDWTDAKQKKYSVWFDFSAPSGFAFYGTDYRCSTATAGCASRLCFKRESDARYAGKTFTGLYRSIIDNKPTK